MVKKMDYKICYLILHYKVIQETKNCVDSIRRLAKDTDYTIVIVDNGSGNGTGEKLQELYKEDEKITVLLAKKNMGFARGNNFGFRYAKRRLKADFICMMNNDTELLQDNFLSLIVQEYENSKCAVMGPEIQLNHGKIQPIYRKPLTVERIEEDIRFMKRQLLYNKLHIRNLIQKFFLFINRLKKRKKQPDTEPVNKPVVRPGRKEQVVLHGSCLIFTPVYIRQFEGLNDVTFMFREEEFLFLRLQENHMRSVYDPALKIRHYEDAATDNVYTKESDKLKFQFENDIRSSMLLIKEIKRLEEEGIDCNSNSW